MKLLKITTGRMRIVVLLLFICSLSVLNAQNPAFDPNDERYNMFGHTSVKTDSVLTLPPVGILSTERAEQSIKLLINENMHNNFYSSYYIERSTDGENFVRLNEEPYFFVGPDRNEVELLDPNASENLEIANVRSAVYTDSVGDYNIYYYRVIGTNNLGQESEPSLVVSEKALKPRIDFTFHLDTIIYDPASDDVVVSFPDFHEDIKSKLVGYQLFRSVFYDGPFDPLNTEIIPTTSSSFTDIDPLLTGYYLAITWDEEGHEYRTYSYLMQLPDDTPPPVPVVTEAVYTEDEEVKITWDESFASDLKGYYVYYANGKNGEYNPINTEPFKGTEMVHDFSVEMEIDSIFFKVAASDNRGNLSDSSPSHGIRRPGKFGAAAPVIHSITPYTEGDKGMVLAFSFSTDDDVKYHKLERRSASEATWTEIARIKPVDHASYATGPEEETYIDSTYIRNEALEYRIMVTDLDDLISSSEEIEAFPINSQQDGFINKFKLEKSSTPVPLPPLAQFDSQIANQLPASSQLNHAVNLSWIYDNDPRLDGFTIFRGVTGGHLIEYRTIPKDDLEQEPASGKKYKFYFNDSSLMTNKRYIYKVMARHLDGSTSHRSNAISVKIN